MTKIIHRAIALHCDVYQAFEMFTRVELAQRWFAPVAKVDAKLGGRYELYIDATTFNTEGCTILAIAPGKLLAFDWKGPQQFSAMNEADPLTHVSLYFQAVSTAPQTTLHLIHSGWRNNREWDAARHWHEIFWSNAFERLAKYVGMRADDGKGRTYRGPTRLR